MDGLDAAVDLLASRAQRPRQPVEFRPIPPSSRAQQDAGGEAPLHRPRDPRRASDTGGRPATVAVDGSSGVLVDNGAAWVVAVRAEAVFWPGDPRPEPQPRVVASAPALAQGAVDDAYARHGLLGPPVRSAEAFAEALRAVAELEAALAAVAKAPPGALLLLDGALRGLPPAPAAVVGRIEEACRARGLRIAGVAKRSGIEGSGVPLVPALLAEAEARGIAGAWSVEAEPGVHIARLHGAARHAFRVDGDVGVLPDLAALSNDAVYVGYPYPLAVAHNRVALTGAHLRELKARLELGVQRRGAEAARVAQDFHDVLDVNVPG